MPILVPSHPPSVHWVLKFFSKLYWVSKRWSVRLCACSLFVYFFFMKYFYALTSITNDFKVVYISFMFFRFWEHFFLTKNYADFLVWADSMRHFVLSNFFRGGISASFIHIYTVGSTIKSWFIQGLWTQFGYFLHPYFISHWIIVGVSLWAEEWSWVGFLYLFNWQCCCCQWGVLKETYLVVALIAVTYCHQNFGLYVSPVQHVKFTLTKKYYLDIFTSLHANHYIGRPV